MQKIYTLWNLDLNLNRPQLHPVAFLTRRLPKFISPLWLEHSNSILEGPGNFHITQEKISTYTDFSVFYFKISFQLNFCLSFWFLVKVLGIDMISAWVINQTSCFCVKGPFIELGGCFIAENKTLFIDRAECIIINYLSSTSNIYFL